MTTSPSRTEATIERIQSLSADWFEPLEIQVTRLLGDLAREDDPRVRLAMALAARQVRLGHVCLAVRPFAAGDTPVDEDGLPLGDLHWPQVSDWLAALAASPLVASVPDGAPPGAPPPEPVPLVLELPAGRLYWRRYWEHEAALGVALTARAATETDVDPAALADGLARLFPPVDGPGDVGRRDQAAAAELAARRRLAVITGGPGTGKTTTVVRVLALLVEQALASGLPVPRVRLVAPTGKAAARLEESVVAAVGRLPVDEIVRASIPTEASTIHRALRPRRDGTWGHTASDPLPADVVVVDEASMIDVALMRALVDGVHPDARLVILGDRDQLASVEAGAVLADVCGDEGDDGPRVPTAGDPRTSDATASTSAAGVLDDGRRRGGRPPIADCIARLTFSFRFAAETGIGALARAVNAGDADAALAVLDDPAVEDVSRVTSPPVDRAGRLHPVLAMWVDGGYGAYLDALDPAHGVPGAIERALAALAGFRVLCAHRRGPTGVGAVGGAVVEALARTGRIAPVGEHWRGRPLLVTRNDDALRLYNGDVGLVAPDPDADGRLRAFFPGPEGRPRAFAPPRLPPHETVFAMSVHKSQGSEFDAVAVVLPAEGSPILTRELLYTAVTRARRRVVVYGSDEAIRAAVARRAERASGLRARLWGDGAGPTPTRSCPAVWS